LIPRTIAGENLIVTSLDLAHTRGNIVTDELHFQGSLNLYRTLQSKGVDIRIVKARNWRIELADVEKAMDRNTKLIAVSGVSQVNGFQPDLKALTSLAHSQGVYVYADMVQAVGAVPVDVRSSGVDFSSCGSQKWLMGDEGLAFLYVREGLAVEIVKRTQFGVRQITGLQNHLFPTDTTLDEKSVPKPIQGPAFYLDVGVPSRTVMAALTYTLPLIRRLGVEAIQAHNGRLVAQLRKEIPRLGYECATPEDSHSALISFSYAAKDRPAITAKLKKANVQVKIDQRVIRVSPSVYNDGKDVDKLLEALS
jgi:selenocysteine lyase/cysteine desulfurase